MEPLDHVDPSEYRLFDPDPGQRQLAYKLYLHIRDLPIVSPHGHVDPGLFSDDNAAFGSPVDLLIIPDHYVYRMLYSQGIALESLGIPRVDGSPVEADHRKIWQIFADHFHLFSGTPTGLWLKYEFVQVFGVAQKLTTRNAQDIYDQIASRLAQPAFRPRALFDRFQIEILCTTDPAWDSLEQHRAIRSSGWRGNIIPAFRPDQVINLNTPNWRGNIERLSRTSGASITSYPSLIQALETQRSYFKSLGATASDHAALTLEIDEVSKNRIDAIFQRAMRGELNPGDAELFAGHSLMEMARMSCDDGLVMQLHPGSWRDHNRLINQRFGIDKGADIPVATEYTRSLLPLLNRFGNDPNFALILFTLDETTYSRELAPLAGHYPAVRLGPPWWFHDSWNGMKRYFEQVMETAGVYNTAGFNDDTRAFLSIPARHDLWRRAVANWTAGLCLRDVIDEQEAARMIYDLSYTLPKVAYRLG